MNFKCDLSWLRSGANPYSVWEQRCNVQCGSVHPLRRRPPPGDAAGGAAVVISVWSAVLRNDRFQLVDKRRELLGEAVLLPLWLQESEKDERDVMLCQQLIFDGICWSSSVSEDISQLI